MFETTPVGTTPVETTFVLIKPDVVEMGDWAADCIIKRYQLAGLKIGDLRRVHFTKPQAEEFYQEHEGNPYFSDLISAMTRGPSLALVLRGEDAVRMVRALNGATDPWKAKPGTIRYDFRSTGGPFNTVHGSDSVEAAVREMEIAFREQ